LTEGSADISIIVNSLQDDNYNEIKINTIPGKVEVIMGPPPINGVQPKDLNGDGKFEDVDGDGKLTFGDVVFFFYNFDKPEIKNYPQYYDFNGDQSVNFGDVISLFYSLP
jgi:alkaline phosphatase D